MMGRTLRFPFSRQMNGALTRIGDGRKIRSLLNTQETG